MKFLRATMFLGLALSLVTIGRAQEEAQVMDEVIARVNSDVVLKSAYTRELQNLIEEMKRGGLKDQELEKKLNEIKPTIIDGLIDQALLVQRAKELQIDVEPQVNAQLLRVMKENNLQSLEEMEAKMREVGVDINEVRRNLRSSFLSDAVRGREVYGQIFRQLTEKEKREFYEKHKDAFAVPGEVTLSRILILAPKNPLQAAKSLERAKEIAVQARSGAADFAALAQRVSEDDLGKKGGKIGTLKMPELAAEVRTAVATAPVGSVTDPIKLDNGYAIFRVDARKEPVTRAFEEREVAEAVGQGLVMERSQQQIEAYLQKLRDDAFIEIDPKYQMPGSRTQSAQIKRTPYSEESQKERKKREKREKKEKEKQQEHEASKTKETSVNN